MVKKEKTEIPQYIDARRPVSVKAMGNIKEVMISDRINSKATIRPISKEKYVVVSTGEVRNVTHHAEDRTENTRNLEKTMRRLRDIINTNVTPQNITQVRFITLTYHENMWYVQKLYTDFRDFNKHFRRYVKKEFNMTYEYIVCVEAQGRGALHLHMIAIFSKVPPYIENAKLADIWGHGFVSIKALDGKIDNIGAYLTSYLTDLDIESDAPLTPDLLHGEPKEVRTESGECKRVIKGGRLKLLPAGINIYRCSRGIRKPLKQKLSYEEALAETAAAGYKKVYESAVKIQDPERGFSSTYVRQIYKKHINPDYRRDD